ncbi:hypothetical protein N790_04805 [Arenimonas malthae CC-JY-1]|uniref:Nucleoprotein/polynucleotide-associated enzyme n=1 Tax=Arenimonas malthae CC-JY-1 TaxID=1384054 RepID=A0A091C3G7_9GAMM|nr:DUF2058 family protein [Arenimonas malthae]KFN51200.1 hypothetical protein N790_04805 [Arenimonas malthae CC-JY-1]
MSNSLREKLLGLGFKAPEPEPRRPAKTERPAAGGGKDRPAGARHGGPGKPGAGGKLRPQGERRPGGGRPGGGKPGQGGAPRKPRTAEEIDLAKAYAIRAQREKEERIEAERLRQEEAARRRAAKARCAELLKDKSLNDAAAELVRHFEYGGKIKRIYVNPDQLRALNAGELAVVQLDGRYLLVTAALADEVGALLPSLVALKVDPNAPAGDDPYADPQYQVPDDLVW